MNDQLKQNLYQEIVLRHNRAPSNFGSLQKVSHKIELSNPICGDRIALYLFINEQSRVEQIKFEGEGCAISKAASSILTSLIKGKDLKTVNTIINVFEKMVQNQNPTDDELQILGELETFKEIWRYPSRVKCVSLCSDAIKDCLGKDLL